MTKVLYLELCRSYYQNSREKCFVLEFSPKNQEFEKYMRNRSGILSRWMFFLLVASLAIPVLGWTALPKSTNGTAVWIGQGSRFAAQKFLPAQTSPSGDVERGRKLFMGYVHFQNEGPPCMGCHNVGENGLLGGGALGPDLTDVSIRRSGAEILGILSNTGPVISPVMQPILDEHPLTESEQSDLIAFLNASVGQPESNKELLVISISAAGLALAAALIGIVYRNRLRGVRKSLLKQAQAGQR